MHNPTPPDPVKTNSFLSELFHLAANYTVNDTWFIAARSKFIVKCRQLCKYTKTAH